MCTEKHAPNSLVPCAIVSQVNWALGSSEEKVKQESIEDELRRVYASIYSDPPRSSTASPPPPSEAAPGGERTESLDLEGWLAVSLSVHAKEVRVGRAVIVP